MTDIPYKHHKNVSMSELAWHSWQYVWILVATMILLRYNITLSEAQYSLSPVLFDGTVSVSGMNRFGTTLENTTYGCQGPLSCSNTICMVWAYNHRMSSFSNTSESTIGSTLSEEDDENNQVHYISVVPSYSTVTNISNTGESNQYAEDDPMLEPSICGTTGSFQLKTSMSKRFTIYARVLELEGYGACGLILGIMIIVIVLLRHCWTSGGNVLHSSSYQFKSNGNDSGIRITKTLRFIPDDDNDASGSKESYKQTHPPYLITSRIDNDSDSDNESGIPIVSQTGAWMYQDTLSFSGNNIRCCKSSSTKECKISYIRWIIFLFLVLCWFPGGYGLCYSFRLQILHPFPASIIVEEDNLTQKTIAHLSENTIHFWIQTLSTYQGVLLGFFGFSTLVQSFKLSKLISNV